MPVIKVVFSLNYGILGTESVWKARSLAEKTRSFEKILYLRPCLGFLNGCSDLNLHCSMISHVHMDGFLSIQYH